MLSFRLPISRDFLGHGIIAALRRRLKSKQYQSLIEMGMKQCQEPEEKGNSPKRGRTRQFVHKIAASCRENSISQDPESTVRLRAIPPIYVAGFAYCSTRAYMWAADFAELRPLPASAYQPSIGRELSLTCDLGNYMSRQLRSRMKFMIHVCYLQSEIWDLLEEH